MNSTRPPAAVRPKRADVRARIVAAARDSFLHNGYQRTNLGEVAARAGFSKGAVYSNFGGKTDLFTAVINEQTGAATDAVLGSSEHLVAAVRDPAGIALLAAELTDRIVEHETTHTLLAEFRSLAGGDPELAAAYGQIRESQRERLLTDLRSRAAELGLEVDFDEAAATLLLTLTQALAIEHAVAPNAMPPELIKNALLTAIRGILQ
ncbi:TetR/AcrR family transcriptional regulator [Microlunatus elymi]|uniref:TetR/AcrR family transcriptional regulator n=1 Tax=Microlunatus elymi TaxID=2596828 RepID=A0A516PUV9_9ACTN|nr:TetR/AcrR family transcriptional regulator [Microlunatus elymi]QDP94949.1 TetR/AcrR family transcriptional regulator [Microlunatus elymi]